MITLALAGLLILAVGAVAGLLIAMTYPGLGGQQPPPQNAAPAGQLVPGVQPGTTAFFSQLRAGNTVINSSGMFVYATSPAADELVASITASGGTDPYGNSVLAGIVSYDPSTFLGALACQLNDAAVLFYVATTEAGPWTEVSGVSSSPPDQLSFITEAGASGGNIPVSSSGFTTVAQVVAGLISAGVFD